MATKRKSRRRKARRNPSTALERLRAANSRADSALARTSESNREYEALRRELGGSRMSRGKRAASIAARHARSGIRTAADKFPLGTVAVVASIALFVGYQMGKPSEPQG
jgi:hypothetical protein